jgi:hypothetical protein
MFVTESRSEERPEKGGYLTPRGTQVARKALAPRLPVQWTRATPGFLIAGMNNSALDGPTSQVFAQYEEKQVNRRPRAPQRWMPELDQITQTELRL